jgi:hypothetical protein
MREAAGRRIEVIAGALGDLPTRGRRAVVQATSHLVDVEERVRERVSRR